MDAELRSLMRNGIEALKQGEHAVAYPRFRQALKIAPQYVPAHVYAGAAAPDRAKALAHLNAARAINDGHPAIRKGEILVEKRVWGDSGEIEEPRRGWFARAIQSPSKGQPSWGLVAGGTLLLVFIVVAGFFALIVGTFYYLNVVRPAGERQAVVFPTVIASATDKVQTILIPSYTAVATEGMTKTPHPTSTIRPSRTITVTRTMVSPTVSPTMYPQVAYLNFVRKPAQYAGKGVRLTGQIVDFGEAMLDGEIAFALLLGPPPGEVSGEEAFVPLVVLGIAPDARFTLGTVLTVYGIGADEMGDLIVQGLRWEDAVLLGEGVLEMEEP